MPVTARPKWHGRNAGRQCEPQRARVSEHRPHVLTGRDCEKTNKTTTAGLVEGDRRCRAASDLQIEQANWGCWTATFASSRKCGGLLRLKTTIYLSVNGADVVVQADDACPRDLR